MKEQLLELVKKIIEKYKIIDDLTQRNFNLLISGNVGNKELFHSFLIADLLNPKGTHGQKELFLDLFFKYVLRIKKPKSQKFTVWTEYPIFNDRRIDIVIEDDKKIVAAIEMKIHTKDSNNQLKDYYTYIKKNNINAKLYYLTLYGEEASDESNKDVEYTILSFSNDIYRWLDMCSKNVYDKPNIRESLLIYKNLIEKLTNKSDEKGEEVMNILLKDKISIEAGAEVYKAYQKAWATKEFNFWVDLFNSIEDEIDEKWQDGDETFYNENYKKNVWYDENGNELEEEESIDRIMDIRFSNSNQNHFGIAFKRMYKNYTIYSVIGYWNGSDVSWIGLEIKNENNEYLSGEEIKDFFNGENFGFTKEDEVSIYKTINYLNFASHKKPIGTFELFDKNGYKKILNKIAQEMIDTIHRIDNVLKNIS